MKQTERAAALASAIAALAIPGCTLYADVPGRGGDDFGPSASVVPPSGVRPTFGPTVTQDVPPPPLSGGTLAVSGDGRAALAADPDRARLYVIDLEALRARAIDLPADDEPGRAAFDASGAAHVAMRRSGDLVTVDVQNARITARRPACRAPRGVAVDLGEVFVACAEGAIVVMPAAGGAVTRSVASERLDDLRDVVVEHDRVFASRFRTAGRVTLTRDLAIVAETAPSGSSTFAWRMVARPKDPPRGTSATEADPEGPILVSQATTDPVSGASYYANVRADALGQVVTGQIAIDLRPPVPILQAVLPVDVAVDRERAVVIAAGNGHTPELPQAFVVSLEALRRRGGAAKGLHLPGQPIAAAFARDGRLLVQSREPAELDVVDVDRGVVVDRVALSTESREDTGWAVFHSNSGGNVACASCHGEGGDDGRTWRLPEGDVRTPSLRGTVAGTAPLHWRGDLASMDALLHGVFTTRMAGPRLDAAQTSAAKRWVEAIPAPPRALARAAHPAAARGEAIFGARCARCHGGASRTNNATVDVGTGGAFQVPSLVGVRWRLPLRHDGCAETLAERFTICSDRDHALGARDADAMAAYLETF